jgi:hypothetical protein
LDGPDPAVDLEVWGHLGVPVLRVDDARTGGASLGDLRVHERHDLGTVVDRERALRIREVVLEVHDEQRGVGVVPGHVHTVVG